MNPALLKDASLPDFLKQLDVLQELILTNQLTQVEDGISKIRSSLNGANTSQSIPVEDRILNLQIQLHIARGEFYELKDIVAFGHQASKETTVRLKIAEGILKSQSGDFRDSIIAFLQAELLSRELHDPRVKAQIEMNIGTVYASLMHFSEARHRYETVLRKFENLLSDKTKGILLHNLGNLYYALGDQQRSAEVLGQAIKESQKAANSKLTIMSQILRKRALLKSDVVQEITVGSEHPLFYINLLSDARCLPLNNADRILWAERAILLANENRDFITQIEAIELIIATYESQGNYQASLQWLKKLRSIEGELKGIQESSRLLEQSLTFEKEQRELEIEQLKKEQRLQREIVLRNEQLEAANEDLRQFAYVVSHDLKEPLRMIGSYTQLIQMSLNDASKDQEEYFGFVKGGVSRLNLLLDGLSNYSTLKSLQEEMIVRKLSSLVDEAKINLDLLIRDYQAEVIISGDIEVEVSPALFVLLLQNLMQNAIKFKKNDAPPKIQIDVERAADKKVIRIGDNGIGIPKNQQSRVFVIFQRLKRSDSEGTGMGLAICKKIVQLHNGFISIEESSANGTVIKIELPNKI